MNVWVRVVWMDIVKRALTMEKKREIDRVLKCEKE